MRKFIFIPIYLGLTCFFPSAWSQELPEVEMRHHRHHHHHHSSSHRHHSSSKFGATGPTGAQGATGSIGPAGTAGATGLPGGNPAPFPPSFGSFYSSTIQIVGPSGSIFFENTNCGPIGPAFAFTPSVGPGGEIFNILQTGFYAISYGIWGKDVGAGVRGASNPGNSSAIALTLNSVLVPGSDYYPVDFSSDFMMESFSGIFHLSEIGPLQLTNISDLNLYITPVSVESNIPIQTSAYINIQFLSPD